MQGQNIFVLLIPDRNTPLTAWLLFSHAGKLPVNCLLSMSVEVLSNQGHVEVEALSYDNLTCSRLLSQGVLKNIPSMT